jgi:hypothetical protein
MCFVSSPSYIFLLDGISMSARLPTEVLLTATKKKKKNPRPISVCERITDDGLADAGQRIPSLGLHTLITLCVPRQAYSRLLHSAFAALHSRLQIFKVCKGHIGGLKIRYRILFYANLRRSRKAITLKSLRVVKLMGVTTN